MGVLFNFKRMFTLRKIKEKKSYMSGRCGAKKMRRYTIYTQTNLVSSSQSVEKGKRQKNNHRINAGHNTKTCSGRVEEGYKHVSIFHGVAN